MIGVASHPTTLLIEGAKLRSHFCHLSLAHTGSQSKAQRKGKSETFFPKNFLDAVLNSLLDDGWEFLSVDRHTACN